MLCRTTGHSMSFINATCTGNRFPKVHTLLKSEHLPQFLAGGQKKVKVSRVQRVAMYLKIPQLLHTKIIAAPSFRRGFPILEIFDLGPVSPTHSEIY